jgi:glycerol-3-phosphate dehydrogenase
VPQAIANTNRQFNRSLMAADLRAKVAEGGAFDVVVIGAGITGAGIALDSALRGRSVLLVDRDDLASGTSSKSSKLVHGGLRYLQQGDVALVREALRERRFLMRNAPHSVTTLPFLLPILKRDGLFPRHIARALGSALWAYDTAGGWRIGRLHRRLRRSKVADLCPGLPADRIAGGYLYYDASADDARLTLDVARTAAARGALVLNHCPVASIDVADGRVSGVTLSLDGDQVSIPTTMVVNAAGVWANKVDELLTAPLAHPLPRVGIRPARGVHISIPWELVRNEVAVVLPVPGDRRSVFLIPSHPRQDGTFDLAYVGTTDTDHSGDLDDPQCTDADVEYLLRAVNHSLNTRIEPGQVLGVWAGLRPLVVPEEGAEQDRTADLSRRHRVDSSSSGYVRVIGGKLTTYRQMAEDTVDAVERLLGSSHRCRTRSTRLRSRDDDAIAALTRTDPSLAAEVAPGAGLTGAEVLNAVRTEMAHTLSDVLTRRSRLHIGHRDLALAAADRVADLMAGELGWDEQQRENEVSRYRSLCEAEHMAQVGSQ